jgi:hypothetical protein
VFANVVKEDPILGCFWASRIANLCGLDAKAAAVFVLDRIDRSGRSVSFPTN